MISGKCCRAAESRGAVPSSTDGRRVGRRWESAASEATGAKGSTAPRKSGGILLEAAVAGAWELPLQKRACKMVGPGDLASKRQKMMSWTPHVSQWSMEPEAKIKPDVSSATDSSAFVDLLEEMKDEFWAQRDAMYPNCVLHNADFRELEELDEMK